MTVNLKKNMKKTPVFKKRASAKKTRSVQSLIAKNKKVLQKLKPQESSDESDDSSAVSDVENLNSEEDKAIKGKHRKSAGGEESDDTLSDGISEESEEDEELSHDEEDKDVDEEEEDKGDEERDLEERDLLDDKRHKKSLAKLKDTDPEFYKFLEENDKKLLQFNVSDSESEEENIDESEKVHKPPNQLEVDSDEDDFTEGEKWKGGSGKLITLAMVSEWHKQLQTEPTVSLVTQVVRAFQAALQTVSAEEDTDQCEYRVDGSSVFNAVVQLCVMELQPALLKLLNLRSHNLAKAEPAKSKRWTKVKNELKIYLADLLKLLSAVSSPNILTTLLKHLHQMTVFFGFYHSLVRTALKQLVALWSTAQEETVRVVAFLCILRLTTNQQKSLLDNVLKMMYVAYISNCKFMSTSTLHNVSFMRRSLAEMFCLDATVSYQHTFLYIRQLAIHLRTAITVHKKESIQAVCNWQYINSLRLWVDLICSTTDKSPLRALLYPLVQVIIGCIKLVSTAQYVPLRFHCCQLLTKLSQETKTYIPVLPFIVESLTLTDFNKKFGKVSMKPMDMTCILRVSKSGLSESGFRDAIVEQVYQLLLEYCAGESHKISFPDIIVPAVIQLKSFVKECRIGKYSQKLRQAQAKIDESARFVEAERRKVTLSLSDMKAVEAWETNLRARGTPLLTFYQNWQKVHLRQVAKQATGNVKLGESFNIPQVKRKSIKKEAEPSASGPTELFPSDSDSDNLGFGQENKTTKKKNVKQVKKIKQKDHILLKEEEIKDESGSDDMEDIVEELRLSDLE